MLKRPHYIALILVGLLTLIVLNLPYQTASRIKLALGTLFVPLFGLSKSSQQLLNHTGDTLLPRSQLIRQNEELRHANQELQIRLAQADGIFRENERLTQYYGWEKKSQWKLKLASVVARDPGNWWRIIQIDVGSRDGIHPDMPVITPMGYLVGRVTTVGLTSSQVALIGSSECKVSAKVEKTGDTGVITGPASPVDNSLVALSFLSSNSNLKPGQVVKTWGEGRIFPKGIEIGQIAEDSRQVELGYTEARVKLAADLGALEEVWVIMQ
jgi:rod shape-determining protein MreC